MLQSVTLQGTEDKIILFFLKKKYVSEHGFLRKQKSKSTKTSVLLQISSSKGMNIKSVKLPAYTPVKKNCRLVADS